MTKEQQQESRAICDKATPGPWGVWEKGTNDDSYTYFPVSLDGPENRTSNGKLEPIYKISQLTKGDAAFIAHARTALPAALDALEEAEKQATADLLDQNNDLSKIIIEVEADRDRLKAENERLKVNANAWRKAYEWHNGKNSCGVCVRHQSQSEICKECWTTAAVLRNGWQFNESRFAEGAD